jgi:hypothetical protein
LIRTYSELIEFRTVQERFKYLRLDGSVGEATFGYDRWMNQQFYRSPMWKSVRREVLIRDNGFDLAIEGLDAGLRPIIHHMNPLSIEDVRHERSSNLDPEFLITVSHQTHNAIHYGDEKLLPVTEFTTRSRHDTAPWRNRG